MNTEWPDTQYGILTRYCSARMPIGNDQSRKESIDTENILHSVILHIDPQKFPKVDNGMVQGPCARMEPHVTLRWLSILTDEQKRYFSRSFNHVNCMLIPTTCESVMNVNFVSYRAFTVLEGKGEWLLLQHHHLPKMDFRRVKNGSPQANFNNIKIVGTSRQVHLKLLS
jgi:hypothetical protein